MGRLADLLVSGAIANHLATLKRGARRVPGLVAANRRARTWLLRSKASVFRKSGFRYGRRLPTRSDAFGPERISENPLLDIFEAHTDGPGIWKPRQYFKVYHRHLAKFVGQPVHVVEIGVYSGGSLAMWRDYFGAQSHIYGIDIEEECRVHARESVEIFIGDQADPEFWKRFRKEVPKVDVVIDDGGHESHQQIATLEGLLPHLHDGGVYICEDIGGIDNPFVRYLDGFARNIHAFTGSERTTGFQQMVRSIHLYPFIVVIEKPDVPFGRFATERRGSEWASFPG